MKVGIESTWSWYVCFPAKEAGKWCYKFLEELWFLETMKAILRATQCWDRIAENVIMIGLLLYNW